MTFNESRPSTLSIQCIFIRLVYFAAFLLPSQSEAGIFDLGDVFFHSVGEGLDWSPNVVTAITQDRSGFIWLGTQSGLVRYDGYQIKRFNKSDASNSLPDDYILSLWAGPDGRVWIGTEGNGVAIYDPLTETFERLHYKSEDGKKAITREIYAILGDSHGGVWIAHRAGLDYKSRESSELTRFHRGTKGLPDAMVRALAFDANHKLWLGTEKGVFIKDGDRFISPELTKNGAPYQSKKFVWTMMKDTRDRIWVGSPDHGADIIDTSGHITTLPLGKDIPNSLSHKWVFSISQVNEREIWIGTFGGGVAVYDLTQEKIIKHIRHNPFNLNSINTDEIGSIFTDRSGLVWVGTWGGGLNRTNAYRDTFRTLHANAANPQSISQGSTKTILELSNGDIWVGTASNGIDILNPQKGLIDGIRPNQNGLPSFGVYSLGQTDNDTVWIGTPQSGIIKYSIKSKKFKIFTKFKELGPVSLMLPGKEDMIIRANYQFFRLDLQKESFEVLINPKNQKAFGGDLMSAARQENGTTWIVMPHGFFMIPDNSSRLVKVKMFPKDSSLDHPYSVAVDFKDNLLVFTKTKILKLTSIEGDIPKFKAIYKIPKGKEKLFRQEFTIDRYGNAWNESLYLNLKTGYLETLGKDKGIKIGGIRDFGQERTKNGDILIPGSKGVLVIDPSRFKPWNYRAPLAITDIKINGLKQSMQYGEALPLSPDTKSLSVKYSVLDYSLPKKNQYFYKLLGYDNQWVETASEVRLANYTNLDPGEYTLVLKGTNPLGTESEEIQFRLTQLPKWYQIIWFRLLLALLAVILIYLFFEIRAKKLKKKARLLEVLVEEKTRDIKSILAAIQQGILVIEDSGGKVSHEHSVFLETLIGRSDIGGKNFYTLLFESSDFNSDKKDQIMAAINASVGEDEICFAMNSHLLPREAIIKNEKNLLVYDLDWNPILKEDVVIRILLVIRDVTEIRALELASKKHHHELEVIQEIINIPPDKFESTISTCKHFIEENRNIIAKNIKFNLDAAQEILRNMHTMKGLARSYSLKSLANASHVAEQYYSESIKNQNWDPPLMFGELNKTKQVIDSYESINRDKLRRTSDDGQNLVVDLDLMEENLEFLSGLDISLLPEEGKVKAKDLRNLFTRIIRCPLEQVIDNQIKSTASLARQLNKLEPLIEFKDPGFSINKNCHRMLNNVFTHLIRNSMDHGIELPEIREKIGKSPRGQIVFQLQERKSFLEIRFSDDGAGLDLNAIRKSALGKGLISEDDPVNPDLLANLIFSSGFSTAEKVSEISGRGVGMDAVKTFLDKEGCSIEISVTNSQIDDGFVPVEFIITLPSKFFQFMKEASSDVVSQMGISESA